MSVYNTFYDPSTMTSISQAIDEEGRYCVLFVRRNKQEVRVCSGPAEQVRIYKSNVRWYRGY